MSWWLNIPHPKYGNYGGFKHSTGNPPIDELDECFYIHDLMFSKAEYSHKLANQELLRNLKQVKYINIKKKVYGLLYWVGSIVVFSLIIKFQR